MGIKIRATGSSLPSSVVTNDDMGRIVETSDEWITTRTGIKERRHCVPGETHHQLALDAARRALEAAGIDRTKLAACIVATISADHLTPSCACMLQRDLELPEETACFDLNAACAGFLYAVRTAQGFLTPGKPYALVVGCEVLSRLTDFTDRSTCVLFGDGAGAVVLELDENAPQMCAVLGSRGDDQVLFIPGATSPEPPYIHMNGQAVFKFAVEIIPDCIAALLKQADLSMDAVDWVILHQANERIIDHVVRKMKIPAEKVFKNIAHYGNTSAASIPIALDELNAAGRLKAGQRALCVGFGGGLIWAGVLITIGGKP